MNRVDSMTSMGQATALELGRDPVHARQGQRGGMGASS